MKPAYLILSLVLPFFISFSGCLNDGQDGKETTKILADNEWRLTAYRIGEVEYDTLFLQIHSKGEVAEPACEGGITAEFFTHECFVNSRFFFNQDGTGYGRSGKLLYFWLDCNPVWTLSDFGHISEAEFNWNFIPFESNVNGGYLTIGSASYIIEFKSDSEFEVIEYNGRPWMIEYSYYPTNNGFRTVSYNDVPPPADISSIRMITVTGIFTRQ